MMRNGTVNLHRSGGLFSGIHSRLLIPALPVLLLFSCAPRERLLQEQALEDAPIITSATYQHTQYNGRGQAVELRTAKEGAPPFVLTYFTSEADLERGRGGSGEAPAEVGDYYVRVERPGGNGYRRGQNIKIEYHIQKAFIVLDADPVQRFAYDGKPKEIAVHAEPPPEPPLRISYTAEEGGALPSPPVNRGRYRVTIVFPGNERYLGASREVELRIE
jgi:hypothetical protein